MDIFFLIRIALRLLLNNKMLRVYQATYDPYQQLNPYVYTLMDSIDKQFGDIQWGVGRDLFWTDAVFSYDIVHIQWPTDLRLHFEPSDIIAERLSLIKNKGIKVVTTCHNIEPHYDNDVENKKIYECCYALSDVILHLGEYSKCIFEKKYPYIKNILLCHHIYDNVYKEISNKNISCKQLKLNHNKKYILCMGMFRDEEERNLIRNIGRNFLFTQKYIIAPSFVQLPHNDNSKKRLITYRRLYKIWMFLRYHVIITGNAFGAVSDKLLPYYYGAADIVLLQRLHILNSGNLSMAYMMRKVTVGPNQGNVGVILDKTNNPIFDANDTKTIFSAIEKAFVLNAQNKGEWNKNYAMKYWATSLVASKLYKCYKNVVDVK